MEGDEERQESFSSPHFNDAASNKKQFKDFENPEEVREKNSTAGYSPFSTKITQRYKSNSINDPKQVFNSTVKIIQSNSSVVYIILERVRFESRALVFQYLQKLSVSYYFHQRSKIPRSLQTS
jgi:hypothetical protein